MRSAPFFEPDPYKGVLGPSLARKRPKTNQNFDLYFSFLLSPLVSLFLAILAVGISCGAEAVKGGHDTVKGGHDAALSSGGPIDRQPSPQVLLYDAQYGFRAGNRPFRAGFWPGCYRERTDIGAPAGIRPAGLPISVFSR